jgi:hypothetical protein
MKTLTVSVLAGAAATLMSLAAVGTVNAQAVDATAVVPEHGNWTLAEREDWLKTRLDRARDDGALDHHEYDRVRSELHDIHQDEERMRDRHDNQLTDNETSDLEARLDHVANQIRWLHENDFRKPW